MSDDPIEEMRAKYDMTTEERIEAVKAWAQYVKEQPVEVWGPQQNRLINDHLESVRAADLSVDQWLRIEDWKQRDRPDRFEVATEERSLE